MSSNGELTIYLYFSGSNDKRRLRFTKPVFLLEGGGGATAPDIVVLTVATFIFKQGFKEA